MRGFPRVSLLRACALVAVGLCSAATLAACTSGAHDVATNATSNPATVGAKTSSASTGKGAATGGSVAKYGPAARTASPPEPGSIRQTVAARSVQVLPPRAVGSTVTYHGGAITASVTSVRRVHADARIPGEIAGPALQVNLRIRNRGDASTPVGDLVAVTALDASGAPLPPLTTSTTAVTGTLAAGAAASGRYVFHLPGGFHNPVTVEVTYAATAQVARFVDSI